MRRIKLFEEFVSEGFNDPGILKAFFMAGGPGSGKSYVASEVFDFPKGAVSSVSYSTGLKLVNSDNAFEAMIKKAGYEIEKIADYAKDPLVWREVMSLRDSAKSTTRRMQNNYIGGRLGQVIDGTGKNYNQLKGHRQLYTDLGYDAYMIFVNTSLEVALERNSKRKRALPDNLVKDLWQEVQNNIGHYQALFGTDRMLIVDNNTDSGKEALTSVEKMINQRLNTPVQNPLGKIWLKDNDPRKQSSR